MPEVISIAEIKNNAPNILYRFFNFLVRSILLLNIFFNSSV